MRKTSDPDACARTDALTIFQLIRNMYFTKETEESELMKQLREHHKKERSKNTPEELKCRHMLLLSSNWEKPETKIKTQQDLEDEDTDSIDDMKHMLVGRPGALTLDEFLHSA